MSCEIVKHYTIATGDTRKQLLANIEFLIASGWQPLGGVSHSMVIDENGNYIRSFAQAMVQFEEGGIVPA